MIESYDIEGAKIYDPNIPKFFNTLHYLAAGYGYWIKMKEPAILTLRGLLADPMDQLQLNSGWNLIGCWHSHIQFNSNSFSAIDLPLQPVKSLSQVFQSIDGKYELICNYDDTGTNVFDPNVPEFFNTLHYISPGYGYWIKMKEPATINFSSDDR